MTESKWIKDREAVNQSTFDEVAAELLETLKPFDENLDFSDVDAREEETDRSFCKEFSNTGDGTAKTTERRLCKCLYFTNTENKVKTKCDVCALKDRQSEGYHAKVIGNFKAIYYEFVPTNKGKGIGNVDLILADESFAYLTEVKPPKGNDETLLRMLLEIETYYRVTVKGKQYKKVVGDKPLRKAILFFKDSPQYMAYYDPTCGVNTKELLKKFGITVFCAEFTGTEVLIKAIG